MSEKISFFVQDEPKPGGSKKPFQSPKTGKLFVVDDCKGNKNWRASVRLAGIKAMAGQPPFAGPIKLVIEYKLKRPTNHYGSGKKAGILKPTAEYFHVKRPDVLKLTRSTEDALTGVVWLDDSQIAIEHLTKKYSDDNIVGASITVTAKEDNLRK